MKQVFIREDTVKGLDRRIKQYEDLGYILIKRDKQYTEGVGVRYVAALKSPTNVQTASPRLKRES